MSRLWRRLVRWWRGSEPVASKPPQKTYTLEEIQAAFEAIERARRDPARAMPAFAMEIEVARIMAADNARLREGVKKAFYAPYPPVSPKKPPDNWAWEVIA